MRVRSLCWAPCGWVVVPASGVVDVSGAFGLNRGNRARAFLVEGAVRMGRGRRIGLRCR